MPASLPNPADSTDNIRLALRSWPEVETYLQTCKGVIIPLGSTEQHGPTGDELATRHAAGGHARPRLVASAPWL